MITRNFALWNSFEQIGDNNSGIQTFRNFNEDNVALISRPFFFASAKYREGETSPLVMFVWTMNRTSIRPGSCTRCQYEGPVPFDISDCWQCNQVSYKSKWGGCRSSLWEGSLRHAVAWPLHRRLHCQCRLQWHAQSLWCPENESHASPRPMKKPWSLYIYMESS